MRKLAASLIVFAFVAAAMVSSFFGGSPSSAQDVPLLTTTPSHTPMVTPLAVLNSDFEGGTDEQGQPFGWNSAGVNKRDRVKCAKGVGPASNNNTGSDLRGQSIVSQEVKIVPPPERCHFMFKGAEGKVSVLRQDVPIASNFQPGQPIEIVARIGGKNLAGSTFALEGILYYLDIWGRPSKIRALGEANFATNDEVKFIYVNAKLETLASNMNIYSVYRGVWLRLKLKYRGTAGQLAVAGVKAHALIPSPTPTGQMPTPACGGEDCDLPRPTATRTPFPYPTPPTGLGGE